MTIKRIELFETLGTHYLIIWEDEDEGIIYDFDSQYTSVDKYNLLRAKINQYISYFLFKSTKGKVAKSPESEGLSDAILDMKNHYIVTVYYDTECDSDYRMLRIRTKQRDYYAGHHDPIEKKMINEIFDAISNLN